MVRENLLILSNDGILHILLDFGFTLRASIFYSPDVDPNRKELVHKIHFFHNIGEVRVYVRANETLAVVDANRVSTRAGRRSGHNVPKLMSLPLWAVESTEPPGKSMLPT
jgi:hypothetical protein